MRRTLLALALALVLVLLLAWMRIERANVVSSASAPVAPVARLRRGTVPVVSREPVSSPADRPPARTHTVDVDALEPVPPRQITLDDLPEDVRAQVGAAALGHLHELVDACEALAPDHEDLGAFLVLDHQGILELDLRPIAEAPGPIQVEDRELPADLVDCLDDALWDQDWSAIGAAVPEGAELPAALTMRLGP